MEKLSHNSPETPPEGVQSAHKRTERWVALCLFVICIVLSILGTQYVLHLVNQLGAPVRGSKSPLTATSSEYVWPALNEAIYRVHPETFAGMEVVTDALVRGPYGTLSADSLPVSVYTAIAMRKWGGEEVVQLFKESWAKLRSESPRCVRSILSTITPNAGAALGKGFDDCSSQAKFLFARVVAARFSATKLDAADIRLLEAVVERSFAHRREGWRAVLLLEPSLRVILSEESVRSIVQEMSAAEIQFVLEQLAESNFDLTSVLLEILQERGALRFEQQLLIPLLTSKEVLPGEVRVLLVQALTGILNPRLVEIAQDVPGLKGAEILLRLCAVTTDDNLRENVLKSLANLRVTNKTAGALLDLLQKDSVRVRSRTLRSSCLVAFYEELPLDVRKQILEDFSERINHDFFTEIIARSDNSRLVKDYTVGYGKNFGPHILKFLTNHRDPDVRKAAKKYLLWYTQ